MGRTALVMDAMAQGLLVRPFDLILPGSYGYWIVCPPASADKPKIKAFREWLLAEAAAGLAQGAAGQG
jgi:LysR family glycine cleavage system transcriptional activator